MTEREALAALAYFHLGKLDPTILQLIKAAYDMGQRTPANQQNVELYSHDQQRVVDFLDKRSEGILGGGIDPIGFLLASYEYMGHQLKYHRKLWEHCATYVNENSIYCRADITETSRVIYSADSFIQGVCDIVGYKAPEHD
jgi:hypothetical protein